LLCDLLSIALGCDSFGVPSQGGDEGGHVVSAFEAPEAALGVEHPAATTV
jgi:hypothetical protein